MATAARTDYERWLDKGLALDITRGKPSPEQLTLSDGLLELPVEKSALLVDKDTRNYGGTALGLRELREIFSPLLQVPVDQLAAANNSSLELMYLTVATSFFHSPTPGAPAWKDAGAPTFLCPVPGYDRHFGVCGDLGVNMIAVPTTADGPDMDVVERLVAEDASVKGMWIVPKYNNPVGWTCSPETVRRLAAMPAAADDFRVYWDNAYAVHDLTDTPDELDDFLAACAAAGNPDRAFVFGSTSKITFAGGGVSFLGSSPSNLAWWLQHSAYRTIGPNRIVQLQHAEFFGDTAGVVTHMGKHREILEPKFAAVQQALSSRLTGLPGTSWSEPNGGYFVSLQVTPGTAARVVGLAGDAGVKLTPAGAPFPGGIDPDDSNIRIAPSFPGTDELEQALAVVADCAVLAAEEAATG
ncbi:aminotransferase [uncultured Jatrophihabitans sp.]|uniref:aminotransferase n=1 Tax=uncultured Jatrophihabitans sp. TaxID=1610747 RepID=UPI0035CBF3D9